MNQIHTANALFIHRNTLKYRLAKISELTDIDLSDPDEKLYLSLSLRLS
jgi:DNA-binding PucR family transcriptional regulator